LLTLAGNIIYMFQNAVQLVVYTSTVKSGYKESAYKELQNKFS